MSKKPRGSIHKIREFELEKIQLVDEFDILQIVGEGWFGKILLVEHRASHTEMVLKAVPKPYVSLRDFYREFHYGLHLGIHRNIVTTYDVAFETAGFYVFTQEYAPLGDLTSNVTDTGVGEVYSKRVAKQIAAALDYMHSKDIVHRDVKLDNVLIYRSDFSRVKLCDFGESYQNGTLVERRNEWLPYSPPEVLDIKPEGTYKADSTHDVWQFAIVVFVCLTGCLPWQKAASDDPRYVRYVLWQSTMMLAMRRTPKLFKLLTSRAQRMFKRLLEPRYDRRPKNLADLTKYMDDRWLAKTAEKEMAEYETDELCPSMYSFHSSPDEKNRLLYNLADYGIETNVDRQTKKNRIKEWIESSVITEEEEEDNDETNSASSPSSSTVSREAVRGHISSLRPSVADKSKEIKTTLKDASHKHFDPRTGALQQGPSEMGATALPPRSQSGGSPFSAASNLSTINNDNSLAGSVLTMGSRADFFNSDMELYNSAATDLHQLGEPNNIQQQQQLYNYMPNNSQYMLTSNNDLFSNLEAVQHPTKNTIGVGTSTVGGGSGSRMQKSILQRSKSDSVKYALSASTPTLNSKSFLTISNALPTQPLNTDSKTVTFSGLTNAWDGGIPHEGMPQPTNTNSINQSTQTSVTATSQQQLQQYFNNNTPYESLPVKDSAYSSFDHHSELMPVANGGVGKLPQQRQQQQQHNDIVSTVRTQNSQQQQQHESSTYRNSATLVTSSMKDTAYDRINSNNIRKRR